MEALDLKKTLKPLFTAPRGEFILIDVPPLQYLKVDGSGDPNVAPEYGLALQALYSVAYAIKFGAKAALKRDFVVPPLEGLWWADDPTSFVERRKSDWKWRMMIMLPDFVTADLFDAAVKKAQGKLSQLPSTLRMETYVEGQCLQAMHVGSYDEEGPLLARLHDEIMPAGGYTFVGPHHEIYLSDPRRVDASKLRTILRQPVKPLTDDGAA